MRKQSSILCLSLVALLIAGCSDRPVNGSAPLHAQASSTALSSNIPDLYDNQMTKIVTSNSSKIYRTPVPILMYHSINVDPKNTLLVAPNVFAAEMKHLKDAGYHTISFKDLENWKQGNPLPSKPILITFDDGYKDNYTAAFPILKKLNMRATIFVVSGFVGGKNSLSWDQIKEMQDSGLIEIGAHTQSHLDLTTLSLDRQKDQILGSKTVLESHIGRPVIAFAYPAGRFNDVVIKETEQAGYEFAVTTQPGLAEIKQGMMTLHRVRVSGDESASAFVREFR